MEASTTEKKDCKLDPNIGHVNRAMGQLAAVKRMMEACESPIKVLQQAEACRKSLGSLQRKLIGEAIKKAKAEDPEEIKRLLEYLHKTC